MRVIGERRSNCLLWAWWRFRVRPLLLVRKRGLRGWRTRGGYYVKRRGRHGLWCHRLWSSDLRAFWGFTVEPEVHERDTALSASLHALLYRGRVLREHPGESSGLRAALFTDRGRHLSRVLREPRSPRTPPE